MTSPIFQSTYSFLFADDTNIYMESIELKSLNQRIDYIFVDMQVKNNGGPSIIRDLKRDKITKNTPIALIADRDADEFQAKRVGADFFAVKPVSKTKLNKFFNLK